MVVEAPILKLHTQTPCVCKVGNVVNFGETTVRVKGRDLRPDRVLTETGCLMPSSLLGLGPGVLCRTRRWGDGGVWVGDGTLRASPRSGGSG